MTRNYHPFSFTFLKIDYLKTVIIISLFIGVSGCSTNRKATSLWQIEKGQDITPTVKPDLPEEYSLFKFDIELLKDALGEVGSDESNSIIVQLPDPEGNVGPFKVWRSSIVSEKLLKKFPSLASYKGFRTTNIATKIRLETPPSGLQVMVTETGKTWYIAPFNAEDDIYMLFDKKSLKKPNDFWEGKN